MTTIRATTTAAAAIAVLAGCTMPSNRILMTGRIDAISDAEVASGCEAVVRVFLAAYGVPR